MGSAQVAGEDDALLFCLLGVAEVALDVGGAQDMTGSLQADARLQVGGVDQAMPGAVGERHQTLANQLEVFLQLLRVAPEGELECIFQYQRQQVRRGLAAEDRALVSGGQEVRQPAYMVHVYVGQHQGFQGGNVEVDAQLVGIGSPIGGGFRALEKAAIHQQAVLVIHQQLMAGAGYAVGGAVVLDVRVTHGCQSFSSFLSPLRSWGGCRKSC
ncbi:hypothetical protein D9M69_531970 [compost metagenome]